MIYGVLMVLVVYFLPEGIVPALRDWWQRTPGRAGPRQRTRTSVEAAPVSGCPSPSWSSTG